MGEICPNVRTAIMASVRTLLMMVNIQLGIKNG